MSTVQGLLNRPLSPPIGEPSHGAANDTQASALPGVKVLLEGPSGTGKNYSLGTILDNFPEVDLFCLQLEQGIETLRGRYTDVGKLVPDRLHVHQLTAPKTSFLDMMEDVKKIGTLSLEAIAKSSDPNRGKHDNFYQMIGSLNDFVDDATGESFGCVDAWGPNRFLVIDGLTGVCRASMATVVGGKPVRSQADWQVAQNMVERLLSKLTETLQCHLILLAHVEREVDPVLGSTKIMASALGKALAPKIPAMFSDVILTVREGSKWTWDTGNPMADLKTRNLEHKAGQAPDFKPILDRWLARGGRFVA